MTRRPTLLALFAASALALAACSGGGSSAAPASSASTGGAGCTTSTAAATVPVTIKDLAYSPSSVQAKVGDVIGFTNQDSASHTATLDDQPCTTDTLANGQTGALTFSAPGTYAFHCKIHSSMHGTIVVS